MNSDFYPAIVLPIKDFPFFISMDLAVSQSNTLKELFVEDSFCIRIAKHFYPLHFEIEEFLEVTSFGLTLLKHHTTDELIRHQIPSGHSIDVGFMVLNHFDKSFLLDEQHNIKQEINFAPIFKQLMSGPFNIIARKRINTTKEAFQRTLSHYRGDTLVVEEIRIDGLTYEEIKKAAYDKKYKIVLLNEIK